MEDFDRQEEFRRRLEEKIRRRAERDARRWEERAERAAQKWENRWERRGHHHSGAGGLIIGVILAGIGVLLLLQNLGILYIEDLWRYWPVILIVAGMSKIATAFSNGGRVWGGAVAALGAIFLLDNLGYIRGHVWNYIWPAVLIIVGIAMLVKSLGRSARMEWWNRTMSGGNPAAGPTISNESTQAAGRTSATSRAAAGASTGASYQNTLNEWAFFGGLRRRVDSQEFEGGDVLAIFGGVRIDLDRAATKREEIRIEANAMFGGIEIRVPEAWVVTVRGTGIFGGYEDKTIEPRPAGDAKPPHLIITGVALFGGVTVKN